MHTKTRLDLIHRIFRACEQTGQPIPEDLVKESHWCEIRLEISERAKRKARSQVIRETAQLNRTFERDEELRTKSILELAARYGIQVHKLGRPRKGTPAQIYTTAAGRQI